jgi:hypothetical protein
MRFRKLRITWTVFCGIATVLLAVLWVRSYWNRDNLNFRIPSIQTFSAESAVGQFGIFTYPETDRWIPVEYFVVSTSADPCHPADNKYGFKLNVDGRYAAVVVPHWLLVACLCTALVTHTQWSKQFSLPTLLIATTLVAVLLGLIVWLR